ncbi:MAG: hypothetical protein ABL920_04210 [Methylotenera sp.]
MKQDDKNVLKSVAYNLIFEVAIRLFAFGLIALYGAVAIGYIGMGLAIIATCVLVLLPIGAYFYDRKQMRKKAISTQ